VNSSSDEETLEIYQEDISPKVMFSVNFQRDVFYIKELRLFSKFFTLEENFLKNKKLDSTSYRNLIYYYNDALNSNKEENLNFKNYNNTYTHEIIGVKSLVEGIPKLCDTNKFYDEITKNCTDIITYNKTSCEIPLDNSGHCLQCKENFILYKNKCFSECHVNTTLYNHQCIDINMSNNTSLTTVKYSYKSITEYLTEVKPLVNITLVDLEFFIKSQSRTIINENVSLFNISKFNFQIEKNFLVINHLEKAIAKTKFIPNKLYNIIIENDNSNKTINVSIDRNTYYTAYINQNFILDFSSADITDFVSEREDFRVFVDSVKLYSKISYKTVIFFYRYKRLFPDDGDKFLVYQKRNLFTISRTITRDSDGKNYLTLYVNKCKPDEYFYHECKKCPENCESCFIDSTMNNVLCRLCKEDKILVHNKCIDIDIGEKNSNLIKANFYNNEKFTLLIENDKINISSFNNNFSFTIFFSIKILDSFKSPLDKHTIFYLTDDIKIDVTILSNTICILELIQLSNKFNPIITSFSIADFYLSWNTYIFSFENLEDSLYNINIFLSDRHLIKNLRRDLGKKFFPCKIHTSNTTSFAISEFLILNKYVGLMSEFYEEYFKNSENFQNFQNFKNFSNFDDEKWILVLRSKEKKLIEEKTGIQLRDNIFYDENFIEKIICQNGFYFDKEKSECKPCIEACSTCYSVNEGIECSKCNNDKGYFNNHKQELNQNNKSIFHNFSPLNCIKHCGMFMIGTDTTIHDTNDCVDFPYFDFLNLENFQYEINVKDKIFYDITVDLWIYTYRQHLNRDVSLTSPSQSNFIDINNQLIITLTPGRENLIVKCEYNKSEISNELTHNKWHFLRCSIKSNLNLLHFNKREIFDEKISNFKIDNFPYVKFKQCVNEDNGVVNSLIYRNLNIWSIFLKYDFNYSVKYFDVSKILPINSNLFLLIFSKNFESSSDVDKKFYRKLNYVNQVGDDFIYLSQCNEEEFFDVETSKCKKLEKNENAYSCEIEIPGTQICLQCPPSADTSSNFILSETENFNNFICMTMKTKMKNCGKGKYFDVHSGLCKTCHPDCHTCYGNSHTQCLSCARSYLTEKSILNKNQCVSKCAVGEFYDFSKEECINGKKIYFLKNDFLFIFS
jgi:hypothetical protein